MARAEPIPDLATRGVSNDDELRRANDLMAKAHTANYFRASEWFEQCGAFYPGFLREHTRIALWNGALAGALRLTTDTVRLGEARLKTGGLGWVTTSPQFRHKGVASALVADTFRYMREHGYHASMLFGIPNFYHRFGYVTTLADYAIAVDALELATVRNTGLRPRPAKPGDIQSIQKLHAAADDDVACSILRTAGHITSRWDAFREAHVFTTEHGKVVAYLRTRDERTQLVVHEAAAADPAYYDDVLAFASRQAHELCVGQLRFLLPPEHALAHRLLQVNSTHETRIVRDEGGMMALVEIGEALESLLPEWESLLGRSALRNERCELTLVVDRRPFRVRANRGILDVSEQTGRNKFSVSSCELVQLVTGYVHGADILESKRRMLTEEARHLVRVLMPKRNPYVWTFDRF